MSATNLITQAVVAGLQAQIDVIQNNLNVANANLQSISNTLTVSLASHYASLALQLSTATTTLTNLLNGYNLTLTTNLNNHIALTYASAHGGISGSSGDYRDSANDQVGNRIVDIVISGVHYYLPASPVATGVCHSVCHSACHSACDCHRAGGDGC